VIQKEREQVTIVNNVPESKCAEHPVLLAFPESYYLKCLFLQKIS
jgi:23S rRNA G2069 N7-methylase RlmK/C1962 C5-methylase RlmI